MAVFLINSRLGLVCDAPISFKKGGHLLPKLRVHFAEFLNASSLERLRFLISSPVSVYGTVFYNLALDSISRHLDYTRFALP